MTYEVLKFWVFVVIEGKGEAEQELEITLF